MTSRIQKSQRKNQWKISRISCAHFTKNFDEIILVTDFGRLIWHFRWTDRTEVRVSTWPGEPKQQSKTTFDSVSDRHWPRNYEFVKNSGRKMKIFGRKVDFWIGCLADSQLIGGWLVSPDCSLNFWKLKSLIGQRHVTK